MRHSTDTPAADRPGPRRALLIALAAVAAIALVLAGGVYAYGKQYEGKALPGTVVLGQDVSGQTPEQIAALVEERAAATTVTVDTDGAETTATLAELGVSVDAETTAQRATSQAGFGAALTSNLSGQNIVEPVVSLDEATAKQFASSLVPDERAAPQDATVHFDEDAGAWTIESGQAGMGVDTAAFAAAAAEKSATLEDFHIEQTVQQTEPEITDEEAQDAVDRANRALEQPMSITAGEDTIEVSASDRAEWIRVTTNDEGEDLDVRIDEDAAGAWVQEQAEELDREASDGLVLVGANGETVKTLSDPRDGLEVTNAEDVAADLGSALREGSSFDGTFDTSVLEASTTRAPSPETAPRDGALGAVPTDVDPSEKWIYVDLSNKTTTAYVGDEIVFGPRTISDGKPGYETATGSYEIYLRYEKQDMTNGLTIDEDDPRYYYTPDVPWVQYFHRGYGFHGAPWVSSFGGSVSHGCVNMTVADAQWLYEFGEIGTRVEVHW
ncbi:MAG: L,D-transpeptidase family protein [Brachybacterium sp.]|nr:L,D-transpeptidase family protein [Brachybacterium sp.]